MITKETMNEATRAALMSSATWSENYGRGMTGSTPQDSSSGWGICYQNIFYVVGPLIIIISVIGVISSSLCIFVFWPDRNKSATTLLLLQLAVVDNLTLVVWVFIDLVFFASLYMDPPSSIAMFLLPYSDYVFPVGSMHMVRFTSTWLVVYITVQRYVAVCHPHKMGLVSSVKVAWIQLAVLVISSVLFSIPRFFEQELIVDNGEVSTRRSSFGKYTGYQLYYRGISYVPRGGGRSLPMLGSTSC